MTQILTLAFVLLFCTLGSARPIFKPYNGIKELKSASHVTLLEDGKEEHIQSFRYVEPVSKRFLEMNYNVRVVPGIISLDKEEVIDSVECFVDGLALHFHNSRDASSWVQFNDRNQGLISGGSEWGCDGVILRKQVKQAIVHGSQVFIETENATHAHFLQRATFSLETNLFPYSTHEPIDNVPAQEDSILARDDSGSFLSSVWSDASSLGGDVQGLVNSATNVVNNAVSGDYSPKFTKTLPVFGINYNSAAGSATGPIGIIGSANTHVSCSNCYMKSDIAITVSFTINDFDFNSFDLNVDGQLGVLLTAELKAFAAAGSYSNNIDLGTINLPTIPFDVAGVPFIITTQIPMNVGATGSFSTSGVIDAHIDFNGDYSFGVTATPAGYSTRRSHSLNYGGKIDTATVGVTADAQIYFSPTIIVAIDKIGGPNLGMKAFLEATATADLLSPECKAKQGISASLSYGAQVTVGAMISIEVAGDQIYGPKSIAARTLYSLKNPIVSGCLSFDSPSTYFAFAKRDGNDTGNNNGSTPASPPSSPPSPPPSGNSSNPNSPSNGTFSIDQSDIVVGTTWTGENTVTCNDQCSSYCNQTELFIGFQFIGDATLSDGNTYNIAVGSYNGIFGSDGACVVQLAYTMTIQNGQVTFDPLEDDNGFAVGYAACDSYNTTLSASANTGSISSDMSTITFSSPDGCSQASLLNYAGESSDDYDFI